jgi:AcrR family transcriptional regulator
MFRDREILRVAARLFYERGYGAVPVDLLGAEAGVTGPAIYSHFRGKAEILAAIYDHALDRMLELAGPAREDPAEELDHLVHAHAVFAVENRELLTVYMREVRALSDDAQRRFRRRQRDYVDRWVDALVQLHPERTKADMLPLAYAAIGLLNSVTGWPREARRAEDLPGLLGRLCTGALTALELNDRSGVT